MIEIQIDPDFQALVDAKKLHLAAQTSLTHQEKPPESSLTIVITDDQQLQQLNLQYLEIDAPTDVLSFPAGQTDPETGHPYLGDIILSYPKAQAQAQEAGHPVSEELQLLVVHGCLHLLGYDHLEAQDQSEMWQAQNQILESLGVSARPPQ